jgi:hypothetical protein
VKYGIVFAAEEAPVDMSPDSGFNELHGLTPEEQERQRLEWQQELTKVDILIMFDDKLWWWQQLVVVWWWWWWW